MKKVHLTVIIVLIASVAMIFAPADPLLSQAHDHKHGESCSHSQNTAAATKSAPVDDPHAGHNHAARDHSHVDEPGARNWCLEHDVPESECTRCNPALIAKFKAAGDWCAEHGLPESHCLLCNPKLEATFAAMRPAAPAGADVAKPAAFAVDRVISALRPANDPDLHEHTRSLTCSIWPPL